jgi:hypothetical protein
MASMMMKVDSAGGSSPAEILLEAHPAFAQLLAKNDEMKGIIERGTEAILEVSATGGSPSRVLWAVCGCVWQAVGAVLSGLCGRLPSDVSPQDAQLRHLMEVNNDLRTRLASCRHDYLRELTELRERCRQLDASVAEALAELLREEPVMFFEPFDFVFDETTKAFIRTTVEEKLRLLMLKGWRKGDSSEVQDLKLRIHELECEISELRAAAAAHAPCEESTESCNVELIQNQKDAVVDEETLKDPLGLDTLEGSRLENFGEVCNGMSDGDDSDILYRHTRRNLLSQATQTQSDFPHLQAGDRQTCERPQMGFTEGGIADTSKNGTRGSDDCISSGKDSINAQSTLLRSRGTLAAEKKAKSRAAQYRAMGNTTFDRLYADAQRRIQCLRERTDEIQEMHAAELRRCRAAARSRMSKKRMEELKGLHSRTLACTSALHEAFESFHFDAAREAALSLAEPGDEIWNDHIDDGADTVQTDVSNPLDPIERKLPVPSAWQSPLLMRTRLTHTPCCADSPPLHGKRTIAAAPMSDLPQEIQMLAEKLKHDSRQKLPPRSTGVGRAAWYGQFQHGQDAQRRRSLALSGSASMLLGTGRLHERPLSVPGMMRSGL